MIDKDAGIFDTDSALSRLMEGAKNIGAERQNYHTMLEYFVPDTVFPKRDRGGTAVLELGCGKADGAIVLRTYFGDYTGTYGDRCIYFGIDLDEKAIDDAKRRYSYYEGQVSQGSTQIPGFTFFCGDATDLSTFPEIPTQVDILVLRHQQISSNAEVWKRMLVGGIDKIAQGGVTLITSYSEVEHNMMVRLVQGLNLRGVEIVKNEKNSNSTSLSYEKISRDNFVLVLKKS